MSEVRRKHPEPRKICKALLKAKMAQGLRGMDSNIILEEQNVETPDVPGMPAKLQPENHLPLYVVAGMESTGRREIWEF